MICSYKDLRRKVFQNSKDARDILYYCKRDSKVIIEAQELNKDIRFNELMKDMQKHGYIELNIDTEDKIIITIPEKLLENIVLDDGANVILESTTNSMFENLIGYGMRIYFRDGCGYAGNRYGGNFFRTSLLKSYKLDDNTLELKTINSSYKFKTLKSLDWIKDKDILADKKRIAELEAIDKRALALMRII